MGQKVHPESIRVGYIHDWKSNWFNERNFADFLDEDTKIREHIVEPAVARRPVGHHDPQERHRGRGQHPHGPARDRDRQVGLRGRPAASRPAPDHQQAGQGQHPRDQAPRARRATGRAVDRRAAPEPRRLPARDEARADERDALGREGRQGAGFGPARRRRDGAHRGLLRRSSAAAHAARRHRLRLPRGSHDVRPDRRQVLDQQGRDHARGLHGRRPDDHG